MSTLSNPIIFINLRYGLTFLLGNYLGKEVELFGFDGWRAAFVVGCSPGLIIAILLFFLEDPRKSGISTPVLEGELQNGNYGTAAISQDQIMNNRAQCVKIFQFIIFFRPRDCCKKKTRFKKIHERKF